MFGFGGRQAAEPKSRREEARDSKKQIRREAGSIRREADRMKRDERRLEGEIKAAAKRGDQKTARILAKQLVQLRNSKEKMTAMSARVSGMQYQVTAMAAQASAAQSMGTASKALAAGSKQLEASGALAAVQAFSQQAEAAGLREEMLDDEMEALFQDDEVDEGADELTAQVLSEIGLDREAQMFAAGAVPTSAPAAAAPAAAAPAAAPAGAQPVAAGSDAALEAMLRQLEQ